MKLALIYHPLPIRTTVLAVGAAAAMGLLGTLPMGASAEASQAVDTTVVGDVLRVKGTHADDQLTLRLSAGDANVLEIDVGDDGTADFDVARGSFAEIRVNGRGGDDLIRVDEANGPIVEPTSIRGGNGEDTILGGSAVETIAGGAGNDFIDGNRGNDVAFMGPGDDTFRWDPGDASDVVEGEDGFDTMLFNGANGGETVDVSANGERVTFFRNPGTITMDLNEVEVSVFNALGGSDTITVNDLAGTDATNVALNFVSDLVADQVIVNGTADDDRIVVTGVAGEVEVTGLAAGVTIANPEFAHDQLVINTLAGNDSVDASALAAGVIQLFVDP